MKLTSTITRFTLLLLCCLMCISCFAGCNSSKKSEDDTSSEVSTKVGDPGVLTDANGYKLDNVPALNYEDDEITILCWNAENAEFDAQFGETVIENSIFERDSAVEARLGIKLVYEQINGDAKQSGQYLSKVQTAFNSGYYWDMIASHTRSTALCASKGLLRDLNNLDDSYLDFSQPWWSQDLIDNISIGSSFFFCTGDISTNLVQMIYCVYFNADMIEENKLESPYDLVAKNEWTLDTMLQMTVNIYQDNNHNDEVDSSDTLGLIGAYYDYPALLHACGVPIVERTSSGSFVLASDYKGDKTMNIMKTLSDSITLRSSFVGNDSYIPDKTFHDGQVMFRVAASGYALTKLSGVNFEYGCVPCPKYTTDQDRYYSAVRQPVSLYGIMGNVPQDRIARITATMECLASQGYRTTTPVIFEESMKYLKSTSQSMTDMLELIRETAWFDFARIYSDETKFVCDQPGYILRDSKSWASYVNGTLTNQVEPAIKDLCALLISNNRLSSK